MRLERVVRSILSSRDLDASDRLLLIAVASMNVDGDGAIATPSALHSRTKIDTREVEKRVKALVERGSLGIRGYWFEGPPERVVLVEQLLRPPPKSARAVPLYVLAPEAFGS